MFTMKLCRSSLWIPMALVSAAASLVTLLAPNVCGAFEDTSPAVDIGAGGPSSLAPPVSPGGAPEELATVGLSNGSVNASFDFQLPRARGDAQPRLGLRYNSSAGPGIAGMGWTLSLPSIVRKGHSGIPRFRDSYLEPNPPVSDLSTDDYYIGGQLLIPVQIGFTPLPAGLTGTWTLYRREIDDGARYFFNGSTWVQQTKSGHFLQFGVPLDGLAAPFGEGVEKVDPYTAGMIPDPSASQPDVATAPNPIYRWDLVRDTDTSGNTVYYCWSELGPDQGTYITDVYDTQQVGQAVSTDAFAHHVHFNYSTFSEVGPLWKRYPTTGALTSVDVTSAQWQSATRVLVRRYMLGYTSNSTSTR